VNEEVSRDMTGEADGINQGVDLSKFATTWSARGLSATAALLVKQNDASKTGCRK